MFMFGRKGVGRDRDAQPGMIRLVGSNANNAFSAVASSIQWSDSAGGDVKQV
jgi:hypothetical protein